MSVLRLPVAGVVLLLSAAASGQPPDLDLGSLELTMRLLPESAATPDPVTRTITLPPSSAAVDPPGLERANEVRELRAGRAGSDTAADARERGREFGQENAERARENREDAASPENGRPDEPPRPELPDRGGAL